MSPKALFSDHDINTGRQLELDLLKGASLLVMILMHIGMFVGSVDYPELLNATLLAANPLIGPPALMMCMGVGIAYSRHTATGLLVRRGVLILGLGLLLNLLRTTIPDTIAGLFLGSFNLHEELAYLFANDILLFAGLSLMLLGVLRRFGLGDVQILLCAVALSFLAWALKGTNSGSFWLDLPLGFLWGMERTGAQEFELNVVFPLFSWFIFVAAGVVFGALLKRMSDKKRFYGLFSLPFVMLGIGYMVASYHFGFGILSDATASDHSQTYMKSYLYMNTIESAICVLNAIGVFGLFYWLAQLLPRCEFRFLRTCSAHIFEFYFIHWIFLMPTAIIVQASGLENSIQLWHHFVLWPIFISLSLYLAKKFRARFAPVTQVRAK